MSSCFSDQVSLKKTCFLHFFSKASVSVLPGLDPIRLSRSRATIFWYLASRGLSALGTGNAGKVSCLHAACAAATNQPTSLSKRAWLSTSISCAHKHRCSPPVAPLLSAHTITNKGIRCDLARFRRGLVSRHRHGSCVDSVRKICVPAWPQLSLRATLMSS